MKRLSYCECDLLQSPLGGQRCRRPISNLSRVKGFGMREKAAREENSTSHSTTIGEWLQCTRFNLHLALKGNLFAAKCPCSSLPSSSIHRLILDHPLDPSRQRLTTRDEPP